MAKTADYTRKAVDAYRKKFDVVQIRLPKGTVDRIKAQGETVNSFVNMAVLEALEVLEEDNAPQAPQTDFRPVGKETITETAKNPGNGNSEPTTAELLAMQAQLLEAQRKQDAERAEKEAAKAAELEEETRKRVKGLERLAQSTKNHEQLPEDPEKEAARAESICKAAADGDF